MANVLSELDKIGIETAQAMPRFLNKEEMFLKYIFKFPEEPVIASYKAEYEAGNLDAAYEHIHNFKGITGNLGITRLYELAVAITDKLRSRNTDGVPELNEKLFAEYERVSIAIAVCRDENL